METPDVVAVINTSPDIVDMLRLTLEHAGIVVVSAMTWELREGIVDLERLIEQHKPKVMVYDVAPPYDSNWQFFRHVRSMPALANVQFVVTTTNERQVQEYAKADRQQVYEIVGKPFDLGAVVTAVREAFKARPTR